MPRSDRDKQRDKQRKDERRAKAIELLGGKCVTCGTTERLQFDHIKNDRQGYGGLISYLLKTRWERLLAELEKCQLLCISCHAVKTGADKSAKEPKHGVQGTYVNRKCRCDKCVFANSEHTRQYRLQNKLEKVIL